MFQIGVSLPTKAGAPIHPFQPLFRDLQCPEGGLSKETMSFSCPARFVYRSSKSWKRLLKAMESNPHAWNRLYWHVVSSRCARDPDSTSKA